MSTSPALLGVALLLLAGCLAPAGDGSASDATEPPQPTPLTADLSLTGCVEVGAGRFVTFEHAQTLLPPGFVAADAGAFLGMPVPAGRAAVLSGHLSCDGSIADGGAVTWSDLIVPIETPDVAGLELGDARNDVYQIAQYASGAETIRLLRSVAFPAEEADIVMEMDALPQPAVASGATHVAGTDVVRFEVAGALPQEFRLETRFWHQTTTGVAVIEHHRTPTPMIIGTLTSCTAASDSPFAKAFGVQECGGSDSIGGIFPERSDFESTLRFLPGVRATAP